jgi:sortase (surface protein transpeptidase)
MGTKMKSTITFVWDLDKLDIADKVRFTTEDEMYEYILDSTSLLIKEALKDARIFDLIKIEEII